MQEGYHESVLLHESIEALNIQPDGTYVDATFGGGGHSRAILAKLSEHGRLFAFDQDEDAQRNVPNDSRFQLLPYNFRYFYRSLRLAGVRQIDGVLADLGVSSYQFDTAERGFSYRFDAPLDMRMSQQGKVTAQTILATYTAEKLQTMFSHLGEVRNARTLAQAIVRERQRKPIQTVAELLTILDTHIMGQRFRYLGQVFQSLRMEVNDELGALQDLLKEATQVLRPNGRLAIITFHSLEDRLVKNWVKYGTFADQPEKDVFGNFTTPLQAVHKKPIEPSEAEIKQNSRAHSARLRVASKK